MGFRVQHRKRHFSVRQYKADGEGDPEAELGQELALETQTPMLGDYVDVGARLGDVNPNLRRAN